MKKTANQEKKKDIPICSQCTLSLPPENIRKPLRFSNVFRGYRKGALGNKWVKGKLIMKNVDTEISTVRILFLLP